MTRIKAEKILKTVFGHDKFYDEQWQTIRRVLQGERILLIEKTGFGKSLCYQFPATQFPGLTVIFSPLIALMRDQVSYLKSKGISAECINSGQDQVTNEAILEEAKQGKIKILYIAPERQENQEWIEAVRSMNLSMVVIDEAHCISVWGHDFRPAFRRIVNIVNLLPQGFPVLATTATATARVADDILKQIVGNVQLIRGNLIRENFRLAVIRVDSEDAKLAWMAEFLALQKENTGIAYVGTRVNTELYATWLQKNGFSVVNYSAGLDDQTRKDIENGLKENHYQCVVSTNALGMGIDKPDIRFIVHTQMPASLIHYYQEIGRAGRDGLPCRIVLLYNRQDKDLPLSFIKNSRPPTELYNRVIEALKEEPLGEKNLARKSNLTQTQVRVILHDLVDQEIIKEVIYDRRKVYEIVYGASSLNTETFDVLREFKIKELEQMIEYAEANKGGMKYLCEYLGDNTSLCSDDCLRRSYKPSQEWQQKIREFRESHFPLLDVQSSRTKLVNGVAASYYGFSNVGSVIHRCKYENGGDFPEHLVLQTERAYRSWFTGEKFDIMLYVPPTESADLVKNFALTLANKLKLPVSHDLKKTKCTKPQKVFQNGVLKRDNVKGAFEYNKPDEITGKKILLIDDIFDSGATIKEIGKMLSALGAEKIAPLTIAKTVGGDIKI